MAIDLASIDKKKWLIIILAIAAGLIAAGIQRNYVEEDSKKKAKVLAEQMKDPEVKKLIGRIETLEKENQDILAKQNYLFQMQQQAAQQPQQKERLSSAIKTPAGKRAITILVDKFSAVGGMVSTGDYVDIIASLPVHSTSETKRNDTMTVTLFQNVLILAVGDAAQQASLPITIALNPQEVGLISFVQKHGSLQLVLRSPAETQAYILPAATWQSLAEYIAVTQGTEVSRDEERPTAATPKQPIEVFRGGSLTIEHDD